MTTKQAKCPTCCPEGGATLEASWGEGPIWICRNCNAEQFRRVCQHNKDGAMTQKQIDAITRIQQSRLRDDDHEVKQLSVKPLGVRDGSLSVVCVVGLKNDSGKWSSIFCREHGHFFVGPRGGITACVSKNKVKAAKYPLIFGWR